ncbi:MAG: hypothetical protein IV092_17095 [Burkholderiaceae bacterium]|nr:hypothetical protein [Burkholderiaceae bacterium]
MSPIHIIPVHGTFARGALWACPESALLSYLVNRLRTEGLDSKVHDFNWSGRNDVSARYEGAKALAELIDSIGIATDEKLFVVAHSHGGTLLSLLFQHFPTQADRVTASVCMATPWISVRAEPNILDIRAGVYGLAMLGILPISVVAVALAVYAMSNLNLAYLFLLFGFVPIALMLMLVCVYVIFQLYRPKGVLEDIRDRVNRFASEMDTGSTKVPRMLCIIPSRDEASALLKMAEIGEFLLKAILRPLVFLGLHLSGKSGRRWTTVSIFAIIWMAVALLIINYPPLLLWITGASFAVLLLMIVSLIVSGIVFGATSAAARLYCRFSVDPTPLGWHEILMIRSEASMLNHSAIYEYPSVHEAIFQHFAGASGEPGVKSKSLNPLPR